jgi:thioredoxin reductase
MLDSGDPRNWETRGIHGFLGLPDVTPYELRKRGRDEARRYGALLLDALVEDISREDEERFALNAKPLRVMNATPDELQVAGVPRMETIVARRVLLAFGIRDVWPEVPGLEPCYGDTVHHCPDCDGYEARGCKTVIMASGRKAAGMAFALATWTRQLTICTGGKPVDLTPEHRSKLDALPAKIFEEPIACVHADSGHVHAVELHGGQMIPCERIFFAIGHGPADDLGVKLGCRRDEEGMIQVDDSGHTSIMNVFAAGDIVPGPHLAMVAAARGTVAAAAIHRSLMEAAVRL